MQGLGDFFPAKKNPAGEEEGRTIPAEELTYASMASLSVCLVQIRNTGGPWVGWCLVAG